jgi:hypothetical protein
MNKIRNKMRLAKVLGLAEPVRNYLKRGPMAV